MTAIRVVIVDDHPMFRSGLATVLSAADGITVEAEAANAAEALEAIGRVRPDVALVDLHLPDRSGIEVIGELGDDGPAVLVLSMLDDDDSLFAAVEAGARGYLLKGAGAGEIVAAVRMVADGGAAFGPRVAGRMLSSVTSQPVTRPFPQLTEREHEILEALAGGATNAAIAARTGLAQKTVRNYLSSIFAKLPASSRVEAILTARDAGLGDARSPGR